MFIHCPAYCDKNFQESHSKCPSNIQVFCTLLSTHNTRETKSIKAVQKLNNVERIQLGTFHFSYQIASRLFNAMRELFNHPNGFYCFSHFRSCVADNALGRAKKYIEVSGKPGPAQFHSPLYSRSRDVYNLTWSVESVPKLDEIRILYRKLMVSCRVFCWSNFKANVYDFLRHMLQLTNLIKAFFFLWFIFRDCTKAGKRTKSIAHVSSSYTFPSTRAKAESALKRFARALCEFAFCNRRRNVYILSFESMLYTIEILEIADVCQNKRLFECMFLR